MPAIETSIRDALVTALDGASFSQTIDARGTYDEVTRGESISGIDVQVFPALRQRSPESRGLHSRRIVFSISIRKKLGTTDRETEIDELLVLADEIETLLEDLEPATAGFLEFIEDGGGREVFSLESLQEDNVFVATILPTYLTIA